MKKKAKKSKPKTKAKPRTKKTLRVKTKTKKPKKAAPKPKARKKTAAKPKMSVIPPPNSVLVGRVEDYFAKIGVIAFTVKKPLHLGEHLHVLGHTTNLEQTLDSMQIEHQTVTEAKPGDAVGIKLTSRARRGDYVFLIKG